MRAQIADLRGSGVWFFLVLNLAVRLWMLFHGGGSLFATNQNDETTYLNIATELANQGPGWLLTPRSVQAAPGHVLLLALIGRSIPVGKVICIAASTLTLVPVLTIARAVLAPRATFWVAIAFTACLAFDGFAGTILTESINAFLLTSAFALLLRSTGAPDPRLRNRLALLAGIVLGLATLWRATTLFYPVGLGLLLLAVWVVAPLRRRLEFEPRAVLMGVAYLALGVALITGPVILKNGLSSHQWKLATGQGAIAYLGVDPKTRGWEPYFAGYDFDTFEVTAPYTHLEIEGDRLLSQAASRQVRRDPLGTLAMRIHWPVRLFIGEPADLFNPVRSATDSWRVHKKNTTLLTLWNLGWRTLALVFGLIFLARNWRRAEGFVLLSVPLYFMIVFLPLFVIARYAVPVLPLLSVPMVGGLLAGGRTRLVGLATSILIAGSIAFGQAVFPTELDPGEYAGHTELARWPDAAGSHRWIPAYGIAERPRAQQQQVFEAMAAAPSIEADGQGVALEHNQIFLLSIQLAPQPPGWPLHAYWRSDRGPAFSEERTTDAFSLDGENTVTFQLPPREGDTLRGFRFDLDVPDQVTARIGDARAGEAKGAWACSFGCAASRTTDQGFELTGGPKSEAVAAELIASMNEPVAITVPLDLPRAPQPPSRAGETVEVALRWQLAGEADYAPANQRVFHVPVDGRPHWVQLNPSLFPSGALWFGTLSKVSLRVINGHDLELRVGPMRLLKDYRMLKP